MPVNANSKKVVIAAGEEAKLLISRQSVEHIDLVGTDVVLTLKSGVQYVLQGMAVKALVNPSLMLQFTDGPVPIESLLQDVGKAVFTDAAAKSIALLSDTHRGEGKGKEGLGLEKDAAKAPQTADSVASESEEHDQPSDSTAPPSLGLTQSDAATFKSSPDTPAAPPPLIIKSAEPHRRTRLLQGGPPIPRPPL